MPRTGSHLVRFPVALRCMVAMCGVLLLVGCGGAPGDEGDDSLQTWDLTQPPTREDIGLSEGTASVVHATDEPVMARLDLPEDVALQIPLVRLAFDDFGAAPARGSDLTGFDARTEDMTLAKLVPLYRSTLEQLGLRTGRVRRFEYHAGKATGSVVVKSRRSTRRYGYLKLTVIAHFAAGSQRGYVSVGGSWG